MASRDRMVWLELTLPDEMEDRVQAFSRSRSHGDEAEALRHLIKVGLEREGWAPEWVSSFSTAKNPKIRPGRHKKHRSPR